MTTYVALLEGGKREEAVRVRRVEPGLYEVRLRERVHLVDAYRQDTGTLSLIVDTASYTAMLDPRRTHVNVRVRDSVFPLEVLDERRLRLRRAAGTFTPSGKLTLTAPIPARVVRVLARVGETVRAGQPLVVVEAMEMENEVRSPKDGRVVELHVAEGQAVEGNARLCAVE